MPTVMRLRSVSIIPSLRHFYKYFMCTFLHHCKKFYVQNFSIIPMKLFRSNLYNSIQHIKSKTKLDQNLQHVMQIRKLKNKITSSQLVGEGMGESPNKHVELKQQNPLVFHCSIIQSSLT